MTWTKERHEVESAMAVVASTHEALTLAVAKNSHLIAEVERLTSAPKMSAAPLAEEVCRHG